LRWVDEIKKFAGIGWMRKRKIGHCGSIWERPSSSSGSIMADDDDDDIYIYIYTVMDKSLRPLRFSHIF
jgi:hypothetical protein